MHHHFSSKFLIQTLDKLGFCKGCVEVEIFQKSAVIQREPVINEETMAGEFLQWPADNADYNPSTIDGKQSIHVMGITANITT